MAEDDGLVPYKDISELKKELEGIRDKKDVSGRELYEAVNKLAQSMSDMLDVFGAAAEQLKLEEKEYEAEAKKHEAILAKLDKLIDQNKTIAEGMVAMVEMFKQKFPEKEGSMFKAKEQEEQPLFKSLESRPVARPSTEWKPRPMPSQQQPMMPMPAPTQLPANLSVPSPDLGAQLPPMEPTPLPDMDLGNDPFALDEGPKKKGLFGMFKK